MGKNKTMCTSCGGTGQISFFQGVSRFLLSMEECPECCGLGYIEAKNSDCDCSPANKKGKRTKKG